MDHRSELRKAALNAALEPVGRVRGRPISSLLVRKGRRYRLPDGFRLPRPFVDPRTARLYQTLLALYVERIAPCVRYVDDRGCLDIIDEPGSRLEFEERKLQNAIRNFRLVRNALVPEGDALLAALILCRVRPDLIDETGTMEGLLTETVARGVGAAKVRAN